MSRVREGAELRVVRGGATVEEVVGVLLALDAAAAVDEQAQEPAPPAGWARAARLEAIGAGRYAASVDLAVVRRP